MHIVLIPGLMNDGWVWGHQIGPLSRLGPVTIARNDGCSSLAAMGERLLATTSGELCLIGHSMGGRVALEAWAMAPQRIAKLALLDTGVGPGTEQETAGRMELVEIAHMRGMAAVAGHWLPPMLGTKARADQGLIEGITAMLRRCDPRDFVKQQQALIQRPDRRALLPSITCPTLLAAGSEDAWAPPARHAEMAATIAGARFEEIAGAGHMLPVERPDQLTALLSAFCAA